MVSHDEKVVLYCWYIQCKYKQSSDELWQEYVDE